MALLGANGDQEPMTDALHGRIREMNRSLGSEGLRVLAIALRMLPAGLDAKVLH